MTKKEKVKTCYLLGTGYGLENTPFDREGVDYIACYPVLTQPCAQGKRIDVVFEMHEKRQWLDWKPLLEKFIAKNPDSIMFMQKKYLKGATEFPLEEIQSMVGNKLMQRYFTSSIAFMIAYAIYAGYKKIILSGIALSVDEEEYSMQRSCFESWMGFAIAKGIDIEIISQSALMNINYMYGYEGNKDTIIKLVQIKEALQEAYTVLKKKADDATDDVKEQHGGLILIDRLIDIFKR